MLTINTENRWNFAPEVIQVNLQMHIDKDHDWFVEGSLDIQSFRHFDCFETGMCWSFGAKVAVTVC